jgi:hypothetical protein
MERLSPRRRERVLPKTQFMIHEIVAELAKNG